MKDYHIDHMQKTVVKYVGGLPKNASIFEQRLHRKYGNSVSVCKQIEYDIKHGATKEQLETLLQDIRTEPSFSDLRNCDGWINRLAEIERHFTQPKVVARHSWHYYLNNRPRAK